MPSTASPPIRRRKPDMPNAVPPQPLSLPDKAPGPHGTMLRFPQRSDDQTSTLTNIESLLREILTEIRERRVIDQADRLERFKRSVTENVAAG